MLALGQCSEAVDVSEDDLAGQRMDFLLREPERLPESPPSGRVECLGRGTSTLSSSGLRSKCKHGRCTGPARVAESPSLYM